MANSESGKIGRGGREEEKERQKKLKYRQRKIWKKCMIRKEKGRKEKESNRSEGRPKARQTLGEFGKWLFHLSILEQTWLSVRPLRRTEEVMRIQQVVRITGSGRR